jgi:hypothetical protein
MWMASSRRSRLVPTPSHTMHAIVVVFHARVIDNVFLVIIFLFFLFFLS